ncbi:MAG: nucleotide exchange factor GrpE [Acidobacteria bacterium]|nr:nucleotide exchange factor GrpE [Acidobacteriota bacterium]
MTDDANLAQPEQEANPAQPEQDTSPPQFEPDEHPAQPEDQASPAQPEDVAAAPAPPVAESEPVQDPAAERDEYRDLLLRKQAEFDNYKKRVERDRAKANRQAERMLIMALLPLLDDFERALGAPAETDVADAYRAGIELIHRQLLEVLRKRGVTPIETAGARFDPNLHEAVAYQASEGREDGEIIDEVRRGYRFDEELLRAAMVRVAKA